MPRKKVYGMARKISVKEASGYERYLSNPLGVTVLAKANGIGASVRTTSTGKSRTARMRRAEQVLRGSSMRKVHSRVKVRGAAMPARSVRTGRFLKRKSVRRNEEGAAAAAAAPAETSSAPSRAEIRAAALAKARATRAANIQARYPAQVSKVEKKRHVSVQTAFGPYKRVRLTDPKTGKARLSFMYRAKGGKLRHIPREAIEKFSVGKGKKKLTSEKIIALREAEKARVTNHGGVFVPNRSKKMRRLKVTRRPRLRIRRRVHENYAKGSHLTAAQKQKHVRGAKKYWKKPLSKAAKTHIAHIKAANAKRKKSKKSKKGTPSAMKRAIRRAHEGSKQKPAKQAKKGARMVANRKRVRRTRKHVVRQVHENKRRRVHAKHRKMHRNAYFANLLEVLTSGAIVSAGFITHRVIVNLVNDMLLWGTDKDGKPTGMLAKMAATALEKATTDADKKKVTDTYYMYARLSKPVLGLVTLAAGVPLAGAVLPKYRIQIGGGMVASMLQQWIVSGISAMAKEPNDSMAIAARELSGYPALEGQASIMPQYQSIGEYFVPQVSGVGEYFTPAVSGLGAYTQAAAGYTQAAAGYTQAAAGYTQAAAGVGGYRQSTGEYFAPADLQGIGQYEGAGEQALLPSRVATSIDDGIRPDGDLDHILDLAESAAGVRGTGEYFAASQTKGGFTESIVPQQSQWIPQGPLWAGTLEVKDTPGTSELPAGILATAGGNGVLSS